MDASRMAGASQWRELPRGVHCWPEMWRLSAAGDGAGWSGAESRFSGFQVSPNLKFQKLLPPPST